jgi:hypothetical protein
MRNSKLALTFLLLIFALSSTVMAVTAQPLPEDVVVPVLQNSVSLDGVLGVDEWSDAVELPVTFRFYNSTTPPWEIVENRTGFIYLKHDCVDLWVSVNMEDPTNDSQSWLAVWYDTNGDEYVPGSGDDEKGVMHPDVVFDAAVIPTPPGYDNDTDLGGSLDIQGASGWAASWLTYEFVHPLNSGDTVGNDPSLNPGDEILVQFMVGDPEVDPMLYGNAYTEQWAYLLNLIITPCPSVGGEGEILRLNTIELMIPCVLIVVAALAGAAGILHNRRMP